MGTLIATRYGLLQHFWAHFWVHFQQCSLLRRGAQEDAGNAMGEAVKAIAQG